MTSFTLRTPPSILYSRDARLKAADHVLALGRRVILVRGHSVVWADDFLTELQSAEAKVQTLYAQGEPSLPQLDRALAAHRDFAAEVVVAVGGGAVIDMGKALSALLPSPHAPLDHLEVVGKGLPLSTAPLPFVAVPTTAGTGAEATKNAVITVPDHGLKVSLRDDRMLPALALVDPALTDNSTKALTLASGLDAITQLIEPYLSCRANPLTDSLCRDRIPAALAALVRLMQSEDPAARDTLALASLTSGIALANSGLGIVHGLAGVIGGRVGAPHGALCGRLLPASLAVNQKAVAAAGQSTDRFDDVLGWIAQALPGSNDPIRGLHEFMTANGLSTLADMGCQVSDFEGIAQDAARASSTKANPMTLSHDCILRILKQADQGPN